MGPRSREKRMAWSASVILCCCVVPQAAGLAARCERLRRGRQRRLRRGLGIGARPREHPRQAEARSLGAGQ
eukprot:12281677-Alexandrium_andersonii.AAC.1